jgi:hypothetical protein
MRVDIVGNVERHKRFAAANLFETALQSKGDAVWIDSRAARGAYPVHARDNGGANDLRKYARACPAAARRLSCESQLDWAAVLLAIA